MTQTLSDAEHTLGEVVRIGRSRTRHFAHAGTYAILVLTVGVFFVGGFMVVLVPKFKDIFEDFGVALPKVTLSLIAVMDWLVMGNPPGILLLAVVSVAILFLIVSYAVSCARFKRIDRQPPMLLRAIGAVRWAIPITRSIDFGLGMGTAVRSVALGLRAGQPLERAASLGPTTGASNLLRHNLEVFAANVRAGTPPHRAAEQAGLGQVFVSALAMIERGADADQVLTHAAEYYDAIAYRWWHALSSVSVPAVTLLLAALVGYIALAMYMPLIQLIESVGSSIS